MIENKNWKILYIPEGRYLTLFPGSKQSIDKEFPTVEEFLERLIRIINNREIPPSWYDLSADNRPYSINEFEVVYDRK